MKRSETNIEQRLSERVPFLKKLIIQEAENGQKVEASGININIGGIGFYSKKFFQKGSRISIQVCLDNKLHPDAVWINAVVVWSRIEQMALLPVLNSITSLNLRIIQNYTNLFISRVFEGKKD